MPFGAIWSPPGRARFTIWGGSGHYVAIWDPLGVQGTLSWVDLALSWVDLGPMWAIWGSKGRAGDPIWGGSGPHVGHSVQNSVFYDESGRPCWRLGAEHRVL